MQAKIIKLARPHAYTRIEDARSIRRVATLKAKSYLFFPVRYYTACVYLYASTVLSWLSAAAIIVMTHPRLVVLITVDLHAAFLFTNTIRGATRRSESPTSIRHSGAGTRTTGPRRGR